MNSSLEVSDENQSRCLSSTLSSRLDTSVYTHYTFLPGRPVHSNTIPAFLGSPELYSD